MANLRYRGPGVNEALPTNFLPTILTRLRTPLFASSMQGGYFFACRHDSKDPKQQSPAASDAMSIGFYWAVGPDA